MNVKVPTFLFLNSSEIKGEKSQLCGYCEFQMLLSKRVHDFCAKWVCITALQFKFEFKVFCVCFHLCAPAAPSPAEAERQRRCLRLRYQHDLTNGK